MHSVVTRLAGAKLRLQAKWLQAPPNRRSGTAHAMGSPESEVVVEERGAWGIITLNRPAALNALSLPMLKGLTAAYTQWLAQPVDSGSGVVATIMQGAGGKAFCAGGDVKTVVLQAKAGDWQAGVEFFRDEYTLDYLIGELAGPRGGAGGDQVHPPGGGERRRIAQVSLLDGTVFAMPECAIGLFPDVGASHFLNRLPSGLGRFLALTGHQFRGADVFHAGLATHFVPSKDIAALHAALLAMSASDAADMTRIDATIRGFSADPGDSSASGFAIVQEVVARCFAGAAAANVPSSVEAVTAMQSSPKHSDACAAALKGMSGASPLSLMITHEQLRRGANLSARECFEMEFRIVARCMQGPSDFVEGVRCRLIDRGHAPEWLYKDLESVDEAHVQRFFAPLEICPELDLGVATEALVAGKAVSRL